MYRLVHDYYTNAIGLEVETLKDGLSITQTRLTDAIRKKYAVCNKDRYISSLGALKQFIDGACIVPYYNIGRYNRLFATILYRISENRTTTLAPQITRLYLRSLPKSIQARIVYKLQINTSNFEGITYALLITFTEKQLQSKASLTLLNRYAIDAVLYNRLYDQTIERAAPYLLPTKRTTFVVETSIGPTPIYRPTLVPPIPLPPTTQWLAT